MINIKTLMNKFKDDKYKFFYVNTKNGQVIEMDTSFTDAIVKDYEELVKHYKNTNETRVYDLREYIHPDNDDSEIKSWFKDCEEDYHQMLSYYKNLYNILSNMTEYTVDYRKFNQDYDCVTHKVKVSVFVRDGYEALLIKFEKENVEDENC